MAKFIAGIVVGCTLAVIAPTVANKVGTAVTSFGKNGVQAVERTVNEVAKAN